MSVPFSKMRFDEIYSSAEIAIRVMANRHTDNPFLHDLLNEIQVGRDELRNSIAFHEQTTLTKESDSNDSEFNTAFKDFRNLAELQAGIPALGEQSKASGEIAAIIARHNRNLHEKPRDVKIALMDSILGELTTTTQEPSLVARAKLKLLFDPMAENHIALKEIEKLRVTASVDKSSVPSPTEASKMLKPLLTKLHKHISDYTELNNPAYIATLTDFDAALAQAKQRVINRQNKASHQDKPVPTAE